MKKTTIVGLCLCVCLTWPLAAKDIVKSGFNVGALPAVSYNTDLGLQYGVLVNLFHYGDGSRYPIYDHSIYTEVSRYTKGTAVYRMYYDSDRLIRGIRSFIDLGYVANQMQDFYGFNGYQSVFDADRKAANSGFYKMQQNKLYLMADFRGNTGLDHFYWLAGIGLYHYTIGSLDFERLNKGKADDKKLPEVPSLYNHYVDWGLIDAKEANGGQLNLLKLGLMYDSRNAKTNPSKGMFTEALLEVSLPGLNQSPYVAYTLMHRQYIGLIHDRLNLAARIGVQGNIGQNEVPFYRRPQLINTFATRTVTTGLGGNSTLRGVLQDRVVGDAFLMACLELRFKLVNFHIGKQNFYIGLNPFWDAGYILKPVDWDLSKVPDADRAIFFSDQDGLHQALGCGLKIAMNQNFVLSADFGKALNSQDNNGTGLYIGLNYLF